MPAGYCGSMTNFEDMLTWASESEQEITLQCLIDYGSRKFLAATLVQELNEELYELLAAKTSGTALQTVKGVEQETDCHGFKVWQRFEKDGRGYQLQRTSVLTKLVITPRQVSSITDLPSAYYQWQGHVREIAQELQVGR